MNTLLAIFFLHFLLQWSSWRKKRQEQVRFFFFFCFKRCNMKTALETNLYRGSWPFPYFSFLEFQVHVNPHTSSCQWQSSIAFCCISHYRRILGRIFQEAHFLMVPGQFFVPSGTWLSQLDNQKQKKRKWVSIKMTLFVVKNVVKPSSYIILEKCQSLSVRFSFVFSDTVCICNYPSFHSLVHRTS